ncbi:sugar-binding protein [Fluviicola sp.]|uniref:sugar-binding protein n=1 Tax=Fluviicola sp. TaxID=1917219 RepID=UPI003D2C70FB
MRHSTLNILLLFLSVIFVNQAIAQDTLALEDVEIRGNSGFKKVRLYDGIAEEDENIRGYTQLDIFSGNLIDFWTSEGKECINGTLATDKDGPYLDLKWDKDHTGCDWVGMGFGWDNWAGKDISYVIDTLSIEMLVKCQEGAIKNLPWALCMEDYEGGQAWIGFMNSFIQTEVISEKWTKVTIPLSLFPFKDYNVNTTNIKQFMIQVFATGTLQIKHIKLVPFSGKLKEKITAEHKSIKVDGDLTDWTEIFAPFGVKDNNSFSVAYSDSMLYFAIKVQDETPRQNGQIEGNLWNGDAIEIAFSTNSSADPKRKFLLLSDQHIGINCGQTPYLWNWKLNQVISEAQVAFQTTSSGYQLECQIPLRLFRNFKPMSGMKTGFEVVVDKGNKSSRQLQEKWNSKSQEGFNTNPSIWGILEYN